MLVACWSSKGGAGTTVVAASLALLASRRHAPGALLVDLAGDAPAALGVPDAASPGVADWLRAGAEVPADALARLEVPATSSLSLLQRGAGALESARAEVLTSLLASDSRTVVVDCGAHPQDVALSVAAGATRSILVTRACFLSLRRALSVPLRPSEIVLLVEPGRSLTRRDVEDCVGAPVTAEVPVDPNVARAVDAGLLAARLPRALARELDRAA